ncbi:MAG: hypothetical protein Q7J69_04675 [Candidatus Omnitrophota bacterium]|nr:hypothetical protein [Candidatus Omnitrophota bacterium]
MRKILILTVAGAALLSSGVAWAHEAGGQHRDRWSVRYESGYGRRHHGWSDWHPRPRYDYWPRTQVVYAAPVNTVVINVVNSNGSYTPVTLRQEGGSYVGPRGERYLHLPTEEQLQGAYGLK